VQEVLVGENRLPAPPQLAAPRPLVARQTGEAPNVRLPMPIAAIRAQGRLAQLSAISSGFQSSEPSLYVGNGSNTYRILCTAAKIFECQERTSTAMQQFPAPPPTQ
jgi:hypothetical protein